MIATAYDCLASGLSVAGSPGQSRGEAVTIAAQLGSLLEGVDWRAPLRTARPELAGLIAAEYALTLVIPRY
jgi:hypothetical protein